MSYHKWIRSTVLWWRWKVRCRNWPWTVQFFGVLWVWKSHLVATFLVLFILPWKKQLYRQKVLERRSGIQKSSGTLFRYILARFKHWLLILVSIYSGRWGKRTCELLCHWSATRPICSRRWNMCSAIRSSAKTWTRRSRWRLTNVSTRSRWHSTEIRLTRLEPSPVVGWDWFDSLPFVSCNVVQLWFPLDCRPGNHLVWFLFISSSGLSPHAGSGVVRIDPLHFLAGCRTRWLNQV